MLFSSFQLSGKISGNFSTAVGGNPLKGGIIQFRTVIGLVRNGPEDHKGNTIAVGGLGNGSTFHLCAETLGVDNDAILYFFYSHKLVTGGNPSDLGVAGIYIFGSSEGIANHGAISRESNHIHQEIIRLKFY